MEKRPKLLRLRRSFLSDFLTSCRTQNLLSDVIHNNSPSETPFSGSLSSSMEPLLPPPPPMSTPVRPSYPSICRPRSPQTFDHMLRHNSILSGHRKKLSGPVSPVSPLNHRKQRRNHKKKETRFGKERPDPLLSSSDDDLFSSDDEREDDHQVETETLFSSSRSFISLSSDPDSIGSGRLQPRRRPPSAHRRDARRRKQFKPADVSPPPLDEKVKGSFAVVKRSRDPYTDFRSSMVEMIMEKQIFGAKDLHQLLNCFLSLNPVTHHPVIVQVFAEICDALFSGLR